MANEMILNSFQSVGTGFLAWATWRVLVAVKNTNEDLKRLILLLTVPVNAMFQDVKKGLIALTPEGEKAKSILQERQDSLISSSQTEEQSL